MLKIFKALILIALSSVSYVHAESVEPGKIVGGKASTLPDWFKDSFLDITEDLDEATESGKHLLLYMHLRGCPYCYKMVEEGFKNSTNTEIIKSDFDVVAINIRGNNEVTLNEDLVVTEDEVRDHFKVNFTPTIVFLDQNNQLVHKVNGYRSPETFRYILDFVRTESYLSMNLSAFIEKQKRKIHYTLRDHESFQSIVDLESNSDTPLLVLFEDKYCELCDQLHDGHLKSPEVNELLKQFNVVRLDTESEQTIIAVDGVTTTPSEYARRLDITYRPSIVMFDEGEEVLRIDTMLYSYHFAGHLRYIGGRHYQQYPESVYEYLRVYRQDILDSGQDIDLSK